MWNNTLQTLMVSTIMAVGVSLSACDNNKNSEVSTEEVSADKQTVSDTPKTPAPNADLDGATAQEGTPVKYDVASWGPKKVDPLRVDQLDDIKSTLGKYRFMDTDAPYLDLIDSEKYLELGWYFANPTDSHKEKELSQSHAKKSYQLARQLMGDEGGKLVADMLSGQIIKSKVIGGQKVELAKCEFYSCMMIVNKSASQSDQ